MSSEERGVVKGVGVKFPQSEVIGGVEWLEMAPRISMSAFELYDRYAPGVAFESLSQSCSLHSLHYSHRVHTGRRRLKDYAGNKAYDIRYEGRHGDGERYPIHCCAYSNDPESLAAAIAKVKEEGGEEAVTAAVNSVDQTLRTPLMRKCSRSLLVSL